MTRTPDLLEERAEHHAREAERLLSTRWLTAHVRAQAHATLALYYATREARNTRTGDA